jgi:hypothetical protein
MLRLFIGLFITGTLLLSTTPVEAGNPDRQGEAGAYELLMNPWARSAGLHTLNTSFIRGVEAMRLNVAGLSRITKTEVLIGHTRYFEGSGINLNAFGFSTRVGKGGAFGISVMSVDFGEIEVTTTDLPEGTGATYSPNFLNLGFAYANTFENKVSVGFVLRGVSESTADLSAFGLALDAGVQYVTGAQDNFKFGISIRNVGSPMRFGGEGLSFQGDNPGSGVSYALTYDHRAAKFELPSVLNIGLSYDFLIDTRNRITPIANFTSNSFSRDQVGAGLEYSFREMFSLRGGYRYDLGTNADTVDKNVYSGLSAGASVEVPLKKGSQSRFGIDYAYRVTNPFDGTHNISVRFNL